MPERVDRDLRVPSISRNAFRYDWPPVIAQSWLDAIAGSRFFYPCSGDDVSEPLEAFGRLLPEFTFSDPDYRRRDRPRRGHHEQHEPDASYHAWALDSVSERFRRPDGGQVSVIYDPRDAGLVLRERFGERTIGVFMHRGDGSGEGGSGLSFLTDSRPFGGFLSYFDDLKPRLADRALVITDGSNTNVPWLSRFYSRSASGSEAFDKLKDQDHQLGGFSWRCVGWMGRRYGPALVWGVERASSGGL